MTFFTTLSASLQQKLSEIGQSRQLQANEVLIKKGACDNNLYLIENGKLRVEIIINGEPIDITLDTGDVVGEKAFRDNRPRTA